MKRSEIEIAITAITIILLLSLIFFDQVVIGIASFIFAQFLPYNVVFEPGLDLSKIDASQILTCLHGGGCPAGVTYVNDDTGLQEEREVIPNQQQPVPNFSPEAVGFPEEIPESDPKDSDPKDSVNPITAIYVIYGLIIAGLLGFLIYLGLRWKKSKK